jgi:Xaa-Pro aminopeptidase
MTEPGFAFDFGARHARARELIASKNLDAIYVTAGANMRYLTGFSPTPGGWPIWLSGLLLPLEHSATLVMTRMYHDIFVHNHSYVQDVRTYMDGQDPSPVLATLFQEKGLSHGRIGVEDWMGYGDYALLTAAVPGLQVTGGQEILDGLRMVKDDQEIEILRRVCRLMDLGYEAAMQVIRKGRTEAEAGMDIIRALVNAGCESLQIAGHFSTLSSRRIRRGDAVDVDLGGVRYRGYCGDSARTIFVGPPTDAERAMYDVVLEAYDRAMELVRPGVEVQAIHQAAVGVIRRAGYDQTWKIGHGIGLTCMGHEAPLLQDGVTTRLEPGMVHVIDPGVFLPGKHRDSPLHIEDVVLVTEDGYELLTQFTHELLWV